MKEQRGKKGIKKKGQKGKKEGKKEGRKESRQKIITVTPPFLLAA
jgi:hypothetical protein